MADKLSKRLEAAREALDSMDDLARMEASINPIGPRKVLKDFIEAAAELARRCEWRPIETAPTLGWVLVLDDTGEVCAAHQQFGYWYAWFDYVGEGLKLTGVTHWMPMPEPPEVT